MHTGGRVDIVTAATGGGGANHPVMAPDRPYYPAPFVLVELMGLNSDWWAPREAEKDEAGVKTG